MQRLKNINWRRYLRAPLIGYLILAVGVGFALGRVHSLDHQLASSAIVRVTTLKANTYNTLIQACQESSRLNTVLQKLLVNPASIKLDRQLVREGRLSQAELDKAIVIAKQERLQIAAPNCVTLYAPLKPLHS